METLTGTVERIVYQNDENHWTVARLKLAETNTRYRAAQDLTTIVGPMRGINVGETLSLSGQWEVHPRHGRNFKVESFEPQLPSTAEGICRYLGSGLIKGIGPKTAERIVERFGEETLEVIESSPERLREVQGISTKKLNVVIRAWAEQKDVKNLMLFLQSHDVSVGLAARIYKTYGAEAINVIRADPYQLAKDIHGVGFVTADALAQKLGLPAQSPQRHAAGLKYVLSQATEDGHVFLPRSELLARAAEALGAPPADLEAALDALVRADEVMVEPALAPLEGGGRAAPLARTDVAGAGLVSQGAAGQTPEGDLRVYLASFYHSERGAACLEEPRTPVSDPTASGFALGRAYDALASRVGAAASAVVQRVGLRWRLAGHSSGTSTERTPRAGRWTVQPAVWRRLWLGLALAVALDLGLCGAGGAVGGYELLAVQHQVGGADPGRLAVEGPTLRTRLGTAAAAFALARVCWWPWQPLASVVGGPGRVVGAVGPLLDLADDGSVAGAHTLDGALPVLAALHQGHGPGDAGARLLDGLRRSSSALRAALFDVRQAEAGWAALDARALPAALRARLVPLAGRLPAADEALRAALAAPSALGATRPRDYLLVPENPWDLRATGGFAGTAALLHAWHGRLTLTASQASDTVGARRPGYVPPPLPLLVYQHLSNWYYRDANWSPDFPTSAALLRYFYWLGAGRLPDGVVAFDTYLLGPLLQITGPVRVPGTTITLTAQHGVHMLDYYVNYAGVGGPSRGGDHPLRQ